MNTRTISFFSSLTIFILTACSSGSLKSDHTEQTAQTKSRINEQLSVQEIAPRTYVVVDEFYHHSNVLVAPMEDGTVLIASSPFETQGAQALVEWVKAEFHPKRIVAVNTHFHADGTGGNDAYHKAGVETWASDQTQRLHKLKGEAMRKASVNDFDDPKLRQRLRDRKDVLAKNTFKKEKGLEFSFGSETAKVIYPGPGHSADNVVVYLPERQVLFGGCMIRGAGVKTLGYTGHADLKRWDDSARSLLSLPVKVVVPGHGQVGGPELIENTVELAGAAETSLKSDKKRNNQQ